MGDGKTPSISEERKRKFAHQIGDAHGNGAVDDSFFDNYSYDQSYEDVFEDAFNGKYLIDLIKAVWGAEPPYKLLDCGSANGLTLEHFEKLGVEAWGIENSAHIHSKTPKKWVKPKPAGRCLQDAVRGQRVRLSLCHMPSTSA